jgi:hypothetical protein
VWIPVVVLALIWLYFAIQHDLTMAAHVLYGLMLVGVLPQLLAWLSLRRRSGRPLVDLGCAGERQPRHLWMYAIFAVFLLKEGGSLERAVRAGAATFGDWLGPALFLLLLLWLVLMRRRGLSIHDAGVLTPECLIEWPEILSWTCSREPASLSIGVRGAGLIRSLVAPKPRSDTVKTWRIPPERVDAAKDILGRQAPVPESEAAQAG